MKLNNMISGKLTDLQREINDNFLIRIIYPTGQSKLVGAGRLSHYIGKDGDRLSEKLSHAALGCQTDKYTAKLRRGIRIDFYTK